MEAKRGSEFISWIGHNNTGKSSRLNLLVQEFRRKMEGVKLPENYGKVVSFNPQRKIKGVDVELKTLEDIEKINSYRMSLIILDDYRGMFTSDKMPQKMYPVLMDRAEYGNDIHIVMHKPKQLLEGLNGYLNQYMIFFTIGGHNYRNWKDKTDYPHELAYISGQLNKYVQERGRGNFQYPNFPHVFVDFDNEKIVKHNCEDLILEI